MGAVVYTDARQVFLDRRLAAITMRDEPEPAFEPPRVIEGLYRGSCRDRELASIWQWRFGFYDQFGHPGSTPESEAAYKALPYGARLMLGCNLLAFFFGPIYYFVKGMWRKGLTIVALVLAVVGVQYVVGGSDGVYQAVNLALSCVLMAAANYTYYLDQVKGSQSWNPFEGMKRRKWGKGPPLK